MQKRAVVALIVVLAALSTAPYVQKGKLSSDSEPLDDWFARYYAPVNDCEGSDVNCVTRSEAALDSVVKDVEAMFAQHRDVGFYFSTLNPSGFTGTSRGLRFGGAMDRFVARWGGLPPNQRPRVMFDARTDVKTYNGRPWIDSTVKTARYNYAAAGCPHGTLSHQHSPGDEATPTLSTSQRCTWGSQGMCHDGARADGYCPCADSDGQLDPDGTCRATADEFCPGSYCEVRPFDREWILTRTKGAPDNADSTYASYSKLTKGGRVDGFCDGTTFADITVGNCTPPAPDALGTTAANPPSWASTRKADYYVYQTNINGDLGTNDTVEDALTPAVLVTSSTSNTITVVGASWATDRFAGGKAIVRSDYDNANWQARDVISNSGNSLTIDPLRVDGVLVSSLTPTPSAYVPPAAGTNLILLEAGNAPRLHGHVSAVLVDLSIPAARAWMAASIFSPAMDMRVPYDWPMQLQVSDKLPKWAVAPPDSATTSAPCRGPNGAWEGPAVFGSPTPAGGEGKCNGGDNGTASAFGTPWAAGQYESIACDVALRVLNQVDGGPFENVQITHVSGYPMNRHGALQIDGNVNWGVCPDVLNHPKFAGSRGFIRNVDSVFPFTAASAPGAACRDGIDNDHDGQTDLADAGCYAAFDVTETADCGDGRDNDGNGSIDYPADTGCTSATDDSELTLEPPPPPPTVVAAFTATPLQGASCVAPCAVHFDGGATDAIGYSRDFHELTYRWTFGDTPSASQSWWHTAETGVTPNKDFGPIVGHVYETPDTYTATLTATDPSGNAGTTTRSIVVADPDDVFALDTYCASDNGSFLGCPNDRNGDGDCADAGDINQCTTLSAIDADTWLTNAAGGSGCNADIDKNRCLFRGGGTFFANASVSLGVSHPTPRTTDPGLISSFGSGRATIAFTGSGAVFTLKDGWQVANLVIDGTGANTQIALSQREWVASLARALPTNRAGFFNVSINGPLTDCWGFGSGGAGYNEDAWFVASVCNKTANTPSTTTTYALGEFSRSIVIGNDFAPNYRSVMEYTSRVYPRNSAMSHNRYGAPGEALSAGDFRNPLQLRTGGPGIPSQRNVLAYNWLETKNGGSNAMHWTKICNHVGGCGPFQTARPNEGAACDDILYENNLHVIGGGAAFSSMQAAVQVVCSNVTIRNNVFDLQGQGALAGGPIVVWASDSEDDLPLSGSVQAYNNTAYLTNEPTSTTPCHNDSGVTAGMRCSDNVVYSVGNPVGAVSGTWSGGIANNDFRSSPVPIWWPSAPSAPGIPPTTAVTFGAFLDAADNACDITGGSPAGAQRGCITQ